MPAVALSSGFTAAITFPHQGDSSAKRQPLQPRKQRAMLVRQCSRGSCARSPSPATSARTTRCLPRRYRAEGGRVSEHDVDREPCAPGARALRRRNRLFRATAREVRHIDPLPLVPAMASRSSRHQHAASTLVKNDPGPSTIWSASAIASTTARGGSGSGGTRDTVPVARGGHDLYLPVHLPEIALALRSTGPAVAGSTSPTAPSTRPASATASAKPPVRARKRR